jgi:hypothetical protein
MRILNAQGELSLEKTSLGLNITTTTKDKYNIGNLLGFSLVRMQNDLEQCKYYPHLLPKRESRSQPDLQREPMAWHQLEPKVGLQSKAGSSPRTKRKFQIFE